MPRRPFTGIFKILSLTTCIAIRLSEAVEIVPSNSIGSGMIFRRLPRNFTWSPSPERVMFFRGELAIPFEFRKLLMSPMFARITPFLTLRKKDSGSSNEGLTSGRVRIICPRSQRI